MKQTVNFYEFERGFQGSYRNYFSYEAKRALFGYLESIETDEFEIDFDPVGLCCEYTEYENIAEYNDNYEYVESIEQIRDKTQVIVVGTESFIILDF